MSFRLVGIVGGRGPLIITRDNLNLRGVSIDFTKYGGDVKYFAVVVNERQEVPETLAEQIAEWLGTELRAKAEVLELHPDLAITAADIQFVNFLPEGGVELIDE